MSVAALASERQSGGGAQTSPEIAPSTPAEQFGATPAAFQDFMAKRKAGKAKPTKRLKVAAPAKPDAPTDERMAKSDKPRKMGSGCYRAAPLIERLRDQSKLDPHSPRVNAAMCQAAEKLYAHFYRGGLRGIQAQDLSRSVGSGDGGACHFPMTEDALFHRQKFREATDIMGWPIDAPYRGAGRLVVAVVCFELTVEDAGRVHLPFSRTDVVKATAMEKLREGLYALAAAWKMF